MSKLINITHLYPKEMNIYGDLGNVTVLVKRLEWRGYDVRVKVVEVGEPFNFDSTDIVFGGGGQDSGQRVMGADLIKRGEILRQMAKSGVPMLVICGMYQLFGRGFSTVDGERIAGIEVFGASTTAGEVRMTGNVSIDSPFGRLIGFENHSGQTVLDDQQLSLGKVRKGFGNNPTSGREGAITDNVIGTYLHGPLLPKNPALADHLLLAALKLKFGVSALEPLDDSVEMAAASVAAGRHQ